MGAELLRRAFPLATGGAKTFAGITVYPTQELLRHLSGGALFRGGPDWPHFRTQLYARHCWRRIPSPVDARPQPTGGALETAESGIWCGPICAHFGHMIADFGMRIAGSAHCHPTMPLVFSVRDQADAEPPPFFWQMLDHLRIARDRVMLVRKPTRFARLAVLPQAERRFGGGPSRAHLRMMDAIAAADPAPVRDLDWLFVSRAYQSRGRFAGEPYLDQVLAAAGVTVFHPENVDLPTQLQYYRRARRLLFSEGSAVHALQLLGHIDADIVVLVRRPRNRVAAASLRSRARSLRYVNVTRGVVHGLNHAGLPQRPSGVSVIEEERLIPSLRTLGIEIAPFWEPERYRERRDMEIAAWTSYRLATAEHPGERATIARCLAAVSLPHLIP